jgi:mono/diheme cytochrome c family protein
MLERLIFERIETRIIVGVTVFVGIMLMIGWVAINESARMDSFETQFHSRAIERGAAMFSQYCTSCHGVDGRGLTGVAPGLNNPQLFGYDYLASYNSQLTALDDEQAALEKERQKLADEFVADGTSDARKTEIQTRLEEITTRLAEGIPTDREAVNAERDALKLQMAEATLKGYDPEKPNRLETVNWVSSLHNFVFTTLKSGRPTSSSYWDKAMPAWSQQGGGPLRDDQLEDLVVYVLNWDKGADWTLEDLLLVQQFAREPGLGAAAADFEAIGTDPDAILAKLESDGIVGDPAHGDELYHGKAASGSGLPLSCAGCHVNGESAPNTIGTWTRVQDERLSLSQFAGYTGEKYLVESIVTPNAFVVDGYNSDVMPQNFGNTLGYQDIADLIAYLETQQ